MLNMWFLLLQDFYAGIFKAFFNTATVESDFLIISWEEYDSRFDLTDFSLEEILYSIHI